MNSKLIINKANDTISTKSSASSSSASSAVSSNSLLKSPASLLNNSKQTPTSKKTKNGTLVAATPTTTTPTTKDDNKNSPVSTDSKQAKPLSLFTQIKQKSTSKLNLKKRGNNNSSGDDKSQNHESVSSSTSSLMHPSTPLEKLDFNKMNEDMERLADNRPSLPLDRRDSSHYDSVDNIPGGRDNFTKTESLSDIYMKAIKELRDDKAAKSKQQSNSITNNNKTAGINFNPTGASNNNKSKYNSTNNIDDATSIQTETSEKSCY
jgi:hypothetical protein